MYNGERTIDACLASLEKLNYRNYEVIVVNDGSTDRTQKIAESYDYIRLINQENRGLSEARNVGIRAATGDIIAFTDADCMADEDWLTYLVARFQSSEFGAVGGPNLAPPDDSMIAACVALSPGAPAHVFLDDEVAEHIPGCNMAFRREALEAISGFDPIFRAAGDDVDVCWRLQNKGYKIGFSPAALVWHFRRNTVRDYLKQQRGYGKAETLLFFKHPSRFNVLGQSRWFGRIYGDLSSFLSSRQPRIYSGVFGRGLFQTLYQPPPSVLACLPMTLEWNLLSLALIACAFIFGGWFWLGLAPFGITVARCLASALRARVPKAYRGRAATLLIAFLIYVGPLFRTLERYRWRIRRLREVKPVECNGPRSSRAFVARARLLSVVLERGGTGKREPARLRNGLSCAAKISHRHGSRMEPMGFGNLPGTLGKSSSEDSDGKSWRLKATFTCALRPADVQGFAHVPFPLCGIDNDRRFSRDAADCRWRHCIGLAHGSAILYQKFRLGHVLYHVLESLAHKLDFVPVAEITGRGAVRGSAR